MKKMVKSLVENGWGFFFLNPVAVKIWGARTDRVGIHCKRNAARDERTESRR